MINLNYFFNLIINFQIFKGVQFDWNQEEYSSSAHIFRINVRGTLFEEQDEDEDEDEEISNDDLSIWEKPEWNRFT